MQVLLGVWDVQVPLDVQTVALKVARNPFCQKRLYREHQLHSQTIGNPVVLRPLAALVDHQLGRAHTLVYPLCRGDLRGFFTELRNRRVGESPFLWPLGNMTNMMVRLLHGLQHLHDQGLIHRDLKPENILVKDPDMNEFFIGGAHPGCAVNARKWARR